VKERDMLILPLKWIADFRSRQDGSVVVEFVMIFPILIWTLIATYTYWDVFRSVNEVQKAAYNLSDLITRTKKDGLLDGNDILGYHKLMNYLIESDTEEADIRVSSITYNLAADEYRVLWSCAVGDSFTPLSTSDLVLLRYKIPELADSNTYIVFEADIAYEPAFEIGLTTSDIKQFIVTKPRMTPQIGLSSCPA
jgi:hypothetical protein